jgi:GNAT superfamily N-acetyltransferase
MNRASDVTVAELTIRPAELTDFQAIASLMGELGYPTRAAEMQMRLEPILQDSRYRTFVAVRDGKVCGMVGTFCYLSYEHNNVGGRILALVVSEKMRGRGIGRALIAAAEKDFTERNITRVAVNTRFTREDAHQFYESLGYTRNGFRFVKTLLAMAD